MTALERPAGSRYQQLLEICFEEGDGRAGAVEQQAGALGHHRQDVLEVLGLQDGAARLAQIAETRCHVDRISCYPCYPMKLVGWGNERACIRPCDLRWSPHAGRYACPHVRQYFTWGWGPPESGGTRWRPARSGERARPDPGSRRIRWREPRGATDSSLASPRHCGGALILRCLRRCG